MISKNKSTEPQNSSGSNQVTALILLEKSQPRVYCHYEDLKIGLRKSKVVLLLWTISSWIKIKFTVSW